MIQKNFIQVIIAENEFSERWAVIHREEALHQAQAEMEYIEYQLLSLNDRIAELQARKQVLTTKKY